MKHYRGEPDFLEDDIKLGSAASLLDGFHGSLKDFWSLEQGCGANGWVTILETEPSRQFSSHGASFGSEMDALTITDPHLCRLVSGFDIIRQTRRHLLC